jgi:hypothetical protein
MNANGLNRDLVSCQVIHAFIILAFASSSFQPKFKCYGLSDGLSREDCEVYRGLISSQHESGTEKSEEEDGDALRCYRAFPCLSRLRSDD